MGTLKHNKYSTNVRSHTTLKISTLRLRALERTSQYTLVRFAMLRASSVADTSDKKT